MELSLTKRLLYFSSGFAFVALPMLASSCAPQQDKNVAQTPVVQGEAQPPAKPQMEQGAALNMELFHKWWAKAPYEKPEQFVKGLSQEGFKQVLFLMREPKGACYAGDFPMASLIKEVPPRSPQCMNFDAKKEVASCDRKHGGDAMQQGCAEQAVLSLELKAPKITVNKANTQEHGAQGPEQGAALAGTKTVVYEYKMGTAAPKEPKFRLHLVGDEPSDLRQVAEGGVGLPDHFVDHQVYSGHIQNGTLTTQAQKPLNTKPPWSMVLASLVLDSDKCTLAGGPAIARTLQCDDDRDANGCREVHRCAGPKWSCKIWQEEIGKGCKRSEDQPKECKDLDKGQLQPAETSGDDDKSASDVAHTVRANAKPVPVNPVPSTVPDTLNNVEPGEEGSPADNGQHVAQEPAEGTVAESATPAVTAEEPQSPSSGDGASSKPVVVVAPAQGQAEGAEADAAASTQKDWVLCEKDDKKILLMPLVKKLRSQFQAPVAVSVVYAKGVDQEDNATSLQTVHTLLPKALERGVGELHKAYMEPAKWRHTAFKLKHKRNQIKNLKITLGTKELQEDRNFAWTAFYPHTLFIEHDLIVQHPSSMLRISYTVTD